MAYYFLIASLPKLALDEELPISGEAFLQACEESPTQPDMEDLRHIIDGEPEKAKHPFVREWLWRETLLRNAIARARAARLGVEPDLFLKECEHFESYPANFVAEIMHRSPGGQAGETTPLERELALDRYRWETIEEMAAFDMFGMPALLAFALKFNLAARWSKLKEEKGKAAVKRFVEEA